MELNSSSVLCGANEQDSDATQCLLSLLEGSQPIFVLTHGLVLQFIDPQGLQRGTYCDLSDHRRASAIFYDGCRLVLSTLLSDEAL